MLCNGGMDMSRINEPNDPIQPGIDPEIPDDNDLDNEIREIEEDEDRDIEGDEGELPEGQ